MSSLKSNQKMCDDYKNAILYGKEANIEKLRVSIKESLPDADTFFEEADKWLQQCRDLLVRAKELANQGYQRDSLKFDGLATEAKTFGGTVKSFICQEFDKAFEASQAKSEPQNTFRKTNYPAHNKKRNERQWLLNKILEYASQGDYGLELLNEKREEFMSQFPDGEKEMNRFIARGELLQKCWSDAWKLGTRNRPESELNPIYEMLKKEGIAHFFINKVTKQYQTGLSAYKRGKATKNYTPNLSLPTNDFEKFVTTTGDVTTSRRKIMSLKEIHPNALHQQKPSAQWSVYIDETGSYFDEKVYDDSKKIKNKIGRIVGLFIPEGTEFQELPKGWHAVEHDDVNEIEKVVDRILSSKCGVLGVSVNAFSRTHAEQWFFGIEFLLDLALRLLPIEGETVFNVYVEQRDKVTQDKSFLLQKTCDNVLNRFRRVRPDMAENLTFKARVISKKEDFHNGYVDAAAFLWNASSASPLFKATGWQDTCFLGKTKFSLCEIIDLMEREGSISSDDWTTLVTSSEARSRNSFISALLRQLGESVHEDIDKWREYVTHTLRHLDSKSINMGILGRQINWLKEFEPDSETLPPRLRLLWLTVQLAEENHRGETSFDKHRQEFMELLSTLYEEDAPLVCMAQLHLAVTLTNEFDFVGAKNLLSNLHNVSVAEPGLQIYGRLLSSFGQHEAFLGNNEQAIQYFRQAIATFKKLSVPDEAEREISQTSAYLVTALMDSDDSYRQELTEELSLYYKATPEEAAARLSCSDNDNEKYHHHILLRYLTLDNEEVTEARDIYLKNRSAWKTGEAHPWEMIEFYRGLLLTDENERKEQFSKAYNIAKEGGATLQVIAAVILGSLLILDENVIPEYIDLTKRISAELPQLGQRVDYLTEQPEIKRSPIELAKRVLPFNFR